MHKWSELREELYPTDEDKMRLNEARKPLEDQLRNPLVGQIEAKLDEVDGMVDNTVAFVLERAAEYIRKTPLSELELPVSSDFLEGVLYGAKLIDPNHTP